VRVLVVVTVLVVVVAGYLAWQARPQPVPVVASASAATPTAEPGAGDGGSGSGTSSDLSAAASPSGMPVVVAVVGKVRRPGVVSLPAGARVADAVRAAGGLLPGADPGFLNLARKVVDGEEIAVGVTPPPDAQGPAGAGPTGSGATATGKVDLNTATADQLDTLPGVGPAMAQRIITYRTQHGGFRSIEELQQVSGIGDARYQDLKDLVTV
jgi:competence protein ComEA